MLNLFPSLLAETIKQFESFQAEYILLGSPEFRPGSLALTLNYSTHETLTGLHLPFANKNREFQANYSFSLVTRIKVSR